MKMCFDLQNRLTKSEAGDRVTNRGVIFYSILQPRGALTVILQSEKSLKNRVQNVRILFCGSKLIFISLPPIRLSSRFNAEM